MLQSILEWRGSSRVGRRTDGGGAATLAQAICMVGDEFLMGSGHCGHHDCGKRAVSASRCCDS